MAVVTRQYWWLVSYPTNSCSLLVSMYSPRLLQARKFVDLGEKKLSKPEVIDLLRARLRAVTWHHAKTPTGSGPQTPKMIWQDE